MKLISLYIENFGGLSRYALEFEPQITTIIRPNGFGKTTLAEFIRAMFYGFPRKSKTLDKSRRQKYAPWNGSGFGGNLVFEHQGQRYRLERTFGMNPRGDTITVTELATGKKTNRFGEEPGLVLFGLDADSFERSTYLPQTGDEGSPATVSILSKLHDLVEDSSDVGNFDKAVAALRARRSALIPYRGSGGSVAETTARISSLQLRLDTAYAQQALLRETRDAAAGMQHDQETIQTRLIQLRKELDIASQQAADSLRQQQYSQLRQQRRKTEERIGFYREKYPGGLPQEALLRRAEMLADRLTEEAMENAVPTEQQLAHCRKLCSEYETLSARLRDSRFHLEQLRQTENRQPEAMGHTASGKLLTALWICGAAGVAAGAALLFLMGPAYALAVLGAAITVLATAAIIGCIRSSRRHKRELEQRMLRQNIDRKLLDLQGQIDGLDAEVLKRGSEISSVFASFGMDVQPETYQTARARLEYKAENHARQETEKDAARRELQSFLKHLGIPLQQDVSQQLEQLRMDIRAMETARLHLADLTQQCSDMENRYGKSLFAETHNIRDVQQIRSEEQRLHEELTEITNRILQARQRLLILQESAAEIPQIEKALKHDRDKLEEERESVRILDATIRFLQQAKENLATAYMGTIRSRFAYYLSKLEENAGETFSIDPELQVQLEKQGKLREMAYFSAGQADLIKLCMRLALVDALFKGEAVFVILDDPFVNLDDAHMEKARTLLRGHAAAHQILYLTCHSSRSI